jgi:hypothetical protein
VPRCSGFFLGEGNLHDSHDLMPSSNASFAVRDRQIEVPESLDFRCVHRHIIIRRLCPSAFWGRVS